MNIDHELIQLNIDVVLDRIVRCRSERRIRIGRQQTIDFQESRTGLTRDKVQHLIVFRQELLMTDDQIIDGEGALDIVRFDVC